MKEQGGLRKRIITAFLALSLFAVGAIMAAPSTQPTIHIEGLELKTKIDDNGKQSIQALVSISASDLPKTAGQNAATPGVVENITGMTVILQYNDKYMEPSDWVTNKPYGEGGIRGDGREANAPATGPVLVDPVDKADPLHHLFFHTNENLFDGKYTNGTPIDPLDFLDGEKTGDKSEVTGSGTKDRLKASRNTDGESGQVVLTLDLRGYSNSQWLIGDGGGRVKKAEKEKKSEYYFDASEPGQNRIELGTVSFRIKDEWIPDPNDPNASGTIESLEEMLKELLKFNVNKDGTSDDEKIPLLESLASSADGTSKDLRQLKERWIGGRRFSGYQKTTCDGGFLVKVEIDSDDVIVSAEPVLKEITINSYEAYTDGQVSDLALAMQKYAESVRVSYVSGKQADMSTWWGDPVNNPASSTMPADGPGMFIQRLKSDGTADENGPTYRFTWNGNSYKLEEKQPNGTFTAVANSAAVYGPSGVFTPLGGDYMISQYFTYWEKEGVSGSGKTVIKTLPTPLQVKLHVIPIKVIDASVDKPLLTYRNHIDEVPQFYSALELANDVKLTLDTTLNGVVPTMPAAWSPSVLDGTVTGIAGDGNPNFGTATPVSNWPIGQTAINDKYGIGDYTFNTTVLETDIQAAYPWLTTEKDYSLDSVRRIVKLILQDPNDPDSGENLTRYVMTAEPRENPLGSEVAQLRVTIFKQEKIGEDWYYIDMYPAGVNGNYDFTLFMPNDQKIEVAPTVGSGWFGTGTTNPNGDRSWNDPTTNASYTVSHLSNWGPMGGKNGYLIEINPGKLGQQAGETNSNYTGRETLRRYINLGGWFSSQVLENGQTTWSDKITAYSEPRTNIYTKSYVESPSAANEEKEFNYTGDRAGLMPFYLSSDLPTFVTLPADDKVETRYDALTGAQPGNMRRFQVQEMTTSPNRWPNISGSVTTPSPVSVNGIVVAPAGVGPDWNWDPSPSPAPADATIKVGEVVTYGADLFARSYAYADFGTVINPDTPAITGYITGVKDRKATVKVQVQQEKEPDPNRPEKWGLTLTYEQNAGDSIKYTSGGEVERVIFDTKQEGYTYEQIVTLTLTNTGNQEIRGLYVDIPTLNQTTGPYFKLVTPPPAILPAGAKATFQISYIPNLGEGTYANLFERNDPNSIPIHIYHDKNGNSVLGKEFEAILKVTKQPLNKVTLVIHPSVDDKGNSVYHIMGDAELVEGITTDTISNADTYSGISATNTYMEGEKFWVLTTPEDEYSLLTMRDDNNVPRVWVYYVVDGDSSGQRHYLNEYLPGGPNSGFGTPDAGFQTQNDNPQRLFWIDMPDQSVTVHVHYYEPLLSKLRLSDLHAYAWDKESEAVLDIQNGTIPAAAWKSPNPDPNGRNYNTERELHSPDQAANYPIIPFDSQKDEYIVFLDSMESGHDNHCGVSIQLRKLVTHINGIDDPTGRNNLDIYPTVLMYLDDGIPTVVCNDVPTMKPDGTSDYPSTVAPTTHHSSLFNAPVEDSTQNTVAQTTVTIVISYDGSALVPPEGMERREYKVRFVRKMNGDEAKHTALPGNSPYGMIENDEAIANKAAAKQEFDVDNRFVKGSTNMPIRATEAGLYNIYWPEAWGTGKNYDKDETALFVYIGEDFYDPGVKNIYNNAGDYIDGINVTRTLEYVQMDTTKVTAADRFDSTSKTVINLGSVPAVNGVIPGETMTITTTNGTTTTTTSYDGMVDFDSYTDIRPGVYKLTYTYKDWDGINDLKFTRPLIVLSHNGDVNADRTLMTDVAQIRERFTTALPHMAGGLSDAVYTPEDKLLYCYRIVDVNNDRNINNVDANLVRRIADLLPNNKLTEFYRPTEYTNPIKP